MGVNFFWQIMESFIRRIWEKLGIDKIELIIKGVFIVRFISYDNRMKVLNEGMVMFDKKTVIVEF